MLLNLHFTYICIRFYLSTINKIESARNYILFYMGPRFVDPTSVATLARVLALHTPATQKNNC